jgi:hypothetical protein
MEDMRNAYRIVVKPVGKRLLGKLTCSGRITLKWIINMQAHVVTVMNLHVP